jgi:hypothetical protein
VVLLTVGHMNNANQNNVLISVLDIENAKKHLDKP